MNKIPTVKLFCLAIIVIALYVGIHNARILTPSYQIKLAAAQLMQKAEEAVKTEYLRRGFTIDSNSDPNSTGLIGPGFSPIMTDTGSLPEKQTATNPDFAAVMVDLFNRAGVKSNDTVAVGLTSSFPALNIAVIAAGETLGLKLITISSVGSSNWGATNPDFAWLDMEKLLYEKGIFHHRSVAASAGGSMDMAADLTPEGQLLIEQAIARNNVTLINGPLESNRSRRMELYKQGANGGTIGAYVNIGGGIASMGPAANRELLLPGLNKAADLENKAAEGIIFSMAEAGVPVIHLLNIRDLAREYGLPVALAPLPKLGEGHVYTDARLEEVASAGALLIIAGSVAFLRFRPGNSTRGVQNDTMLVGTPDRKPKA